MNYLDNTALVGGGTGTVQFYHNGEEKANEQRKTDMVGQEFIPQQDNEPNH